MFPLKLEQKLGESECLEVRMLKDHSKFREDEEKGMVCPTMKSALQAEFPEASVLVALGATMKLDNTVR